MVQGCRLSPILKNSTDAVGFQGSPHQDAEIAQLCAVTTGVLHDHTFFWQGILFVLWIHIYLT